MASINLSAYNDNNKHIAAINFVCLTLLDKEHERPLWLVRTVDRICSRIFCYKYNVLFEDDELLPFFQLYTKPFEIYSALKSLY